MADVVTVPQAPVAPSAPVTTSDSVADVSWSKMFEDTATTGDNSSPAPTQSVAPTADAPATPAAAPQVPATADPATLPFLKAGESVYMSPEDAQAGISQKDNLIAQLRNHAIQLSGVDPLTGRQVAQPQPQYQGQPQYAQPQQPVSYLQNQAQYFVDLKKAVDSGNQAEYTRIQAQLINESVQQQFGAYAPIMQGVARNNAIVAVSAQIPEFTSFVTSDAYRATLQSNPTLAQAVQAGESDPQFAQQLPDLYKMVWSLNNSRVLSEAFKTQQKNAANPQNVARPTAAPTHATPGPQATMNQGNFRTDDAARKALIASFESSGRDGKI